jgi:nucleoside recognition membrane protein YjiH
MTPTGDFSHRTLGVSAAGMALFDLGPALFMLAQALSAGSLLAVLAVVLVSGPWVGVLAAVAIAEVRRPGDIRAR